MFHAKVVPVTAAPTLLVEASQRRQAILIKNPDLTDSVKVGGVDVTFAQGFSIKAGDTLVLGTSQFSREAKGAVWAITNTGIAINVEILEFNIENL